MPDLEKNFKRGFTLIELTVTLTIFVLLTAVVLIKNSSFKNNLLIKNLAYEVALSIREVQVYGINVSAYREEDDATSYSYGRGIHFSMDNQDEFKLFVDADSSNTYDEFTEGEEDQGATVFKIKGGNSIYDICVVDQNGEQCSGDGYFIVDITFKRPDPEARIKSDGDSYGEMMKAARIYLQSPDGIRQMVEVKSTGQISVSDVPTP